MSEPSSLPLFAPNTDPGPSFAELLRQVSPHQLPGAGTTGPGGLAEVPHGTTVVAIRYADGVVMAGDRRATAGYTIANRRIDKVFAADDFSGVAIAGRGGTGDRDGQALPDPARALREGAGRGAEPRRQGQPARHARARQPPRRDAGPRGRAAVRGLRPAPRRSAGSSPTTSPAAATKKPTTRARVRAVSTPATGSRRGWTEGMSLDDTVALAIRALFAAADEDVATGGPDLVRGIFPLVAAIDADGFRALDDADVEHTQPSAPRRPRTGRCMKARRRSRPGHSRPGEGRRSQPHEHALLRLARNR